MFQDAAANKKTDGPVGKAMQTIQHVDRFSRKLQRRLTRRTLAEAKALKEHSAEAIHVLIYVAELVSRNIFLINALVIFNIYSYRLRPILKWLFKKVKNCGEVWVRTNRRIKLAQRLWSSWLLCWPGNQPEELYISSISLASVSAGYLDICPIP